MLGHAIATSEGHREESRHRGHIYYTSFVAPFRLYERYEGPRHPPHPKGIDLVFFFPSRVSVVQRVRAREVPP